MIGKTEFWKKIVSWLHTTSGRGFGNGGSIERSGACLQKVRAKNDPASRTIKRILFIRLVLRGAKVYNYSDMMMTSCILY